MPEASRHFAVELAWQAGDPAVLSTGAAGRIAGTGVGTAAAEAPGWRPEQLLLGALGLCLTRSYEALARREGLHLECCHVRMEATLGPTPYGAGVKPGFTLLTAHMDVAVPRGELSRARDLAIQAKQACVVANALMPPLHLELAVEEVQPLMAHAER